MNNEETLMETFQKVGNDFDLTNLIQSSLHSKSLNIDSRGPTSGRISRSWIILRMRLRRSSRDWPVDCSQEYAEWKGAKRIARKQWSIG